MNKDDDDGGIKGGAEGRLWVVVGGEEAIY